MGCNMATQQVPVYPSDFIGEESNKGQFPNSNIVPTSSNNSQNQCPCSFRMDDLYRQFYAQVSMKTVVINFGPIAASGSSSTLIDSPAYNNSVPTGKKWYVFKFIGPARDVNGNSVDADWTLRLNNLPSLNSIMIYPVGSGNRDVKLPLPAETNQAFSGTVQNLLDVAARMFFVFFVLEVPDYFTTQPGAYEFIHELWKGA